MSFNNESIIPKFRSHENLWSLQLTATGLRSTAPLFEKLRDETCLHECLLLSFLSSRYSIVLLLLLLSLSLFLFYQLFLLSSFSLSPFAFGGWGFIRFSRSFLVALLSPSLLYGVSLLSLAHSIPSTTFPPCRWKVCWFARWPVVSTPLHMVTYHQSTPTTRFAPRAPWIFMGRK